MVTFTVVELSSSDSDLILYELEYNKENVDLVMSCQEMGRSISENQIYGPYTRKNIDMSIVIKDDGR